MEQEESANVCTSRREAVACAGSRSALLTANTNRTSLSPALGAETPSLTYMDLQLLLKEGIRSHHSVNNTTCKKRRTIRSYKYAPGIPRCWRRGPAGQCEAGIHQNLRRPQHTAQLRASSAAAQSSGPPSGQGQIAASRLLPEHSSPVWKPITTFASMSVFCQIHPSLHK